MYNRRVMARRLAYKPILFAVCVSAAMHAGLLELPRVSAQSRANDWEKAAGGKMSFDVASVEQNTSGLPPAGDPIHININILLDEDDSDESTHGLLSITNFDVPNLISFAYKLGASEAREMAAKLPRWAQQDRFDVEAQGPDSATKDQMRLMMQSLLADRFKLAAHFQAHDAPIYNLALAKPGKMGPQLRLHSDADPCFADDELPRPCGTLFVRNAPDGAISVGSSDVSMQKIANQLSALPPAKIDRPVVDGTGLTGNYDFSITFPKGVLGAGLSASEPEPSFGKLLKDQLGLKLESATGPVRSFVVDHIEEPTPN